MYSSGQEKENTMAECTEILNERNRHGGKESEFGENEVENLPRIPKLSATDD